MWSFQLISAQYVKHMNRDSMYWVSRIQRDRKKKNRGRRHPCWANLHTTMQGTDQRRTSKHARWKLHALVRKTSRLVNFLLLRAFSRRSRESGGDSTSTPPPPRQASRRATASAMSEPQPWAASEGSTDKEDGDWAGASSSADQGRRVGRQGPSNLHAAGETLPCAAEAVRIRLLERQ